MKFVPLDTISILMEGYVENKIISLRGTLVPTTINKFVGSIPILGDILVEKTGEVYLV